MPEVVREGEVHEEKVVHGAAGYGSDPDHYMGAGGGAGVKEAEERKGYEETLGDENSGMVR